jgi:hypothetical protein
VTALVDAILDMNSEYLSGWPVADPISWPDVQPKQPAHRWMEELRPLLADDQLRFGRLTAVCLCLLHSEVTRAAERSGVLSGVAHSITPDLGELLTAAGRRLLQRRAPIAALGLDLLPAALEQPAPSGEGVARLVSLARQAPGADAGIGKWAAAFSRGFYAGRGKSSRRVLEGTPAIALGWSRSNRVHAVLAGSDGPGLMRYDPASDQLEVVEGWPVAGYAAVSEDHIAVSASDGSGLFWGETDAGAPRSLESLAGPFGQVAVAGDRVAVVTDDRLHIGLDLFWLDGGGVPPSAQLTATPQNVVMGTPTGAVRRLSLDEDFARRKFLSPGPTSTVTPFLVDVANPVGAPLTSSPSRHAEDAITALVGAGDLTVAATRRGVAVLCADAVVARWTTRGAVTALGVSPDGAALAVATDDFGIRFWRIDAQQDLRLTSYTPDSPEGPDLLGIEPTVDALAALIAAVVVKPPLSVGLFGSWGSGKSFFMKQLKARVDTLTQESRKSGRAQSALWAWRNIRQVEFNAWHYASADVWAGMLEQLIRSLIQPCGGHLQLPDGLDDLQKRRIERLTGARVATDQASVSVQAAEVNLEDARSNVLAAHQEERRRAADALRARHEAIRQEVSETVVPGLGAVDGMPGPGVLTGSLQEVTATLAAFRRSASSLHGLLRGGGWWRLMAAVLSGPILAVVVALIVHAVEPTFTAAAATVSSLAATGTAVAGWLRSGTAKIDRKVAAIDRIESTARQELEAAQQAVRAADLAAAEAGQGVAVAKAEAARAVQELATAAKRAASSGGGDLLVEYLEGRQTSSDYRSQLGLIGTVRTDLDVISTAVECRNEDMPDDDVVNRVVLYVDDLDRCPPAVVVRVLEAVHLLLSYPLFVVVVAVDAHWVSKSLAATYPTLLSGGEVTPDNYLEKIFQLPVWLDPPPPELAAAMALALLGSDVPRERVADESVPTTDSTSDPAPVTEDRRSGELSRTALGTGESHRHLATSPPESVVVHEDERLAISRLAPLLTRSPRALKRYINTYRLLKAVLREHDLEQARFLLAVATGRPALGERLLDEVTSARPQSPLTAVLDRWSRSEREWLSAAVPGATPWRHYLCGELAPAAEHVRRFVFRASAGAELGDRPSAPGRSGAPAPR